VDFDGDGIPDMVSGSYDPGEFYLFRGKGNGEFHARETLKDKNGKPILLYPDQKQKWESFGSWIAVVDWNNDGAPDLVLGGYRGEIMVRLNEGTRAKPAFATKNIRVQADGKDLVVPGNHATPVIVDWDGDGLWDILSGSETGAVYFYRNIGKLGAPKFAAPVQLVPEHVGTGYNEFLDAGAEPVPGIRSQIAVADWNGDGKLDLLVGDFCTTMSPRGDLTPVQRGAMLDLRKKMAVTEAALKKQRERIDAAFEKIVKTYTRDQLADKETNARLVKQRGEMFKAPAFKKLADAHGEQMKALKQYLAKPAKQTINLDDLSTAHGYVWVYLRK
jgi:hypothetical protein